MRLFAEMNRVTGKKLPLVTIFQSPTIERLARHLGQGHAELSRSLVVPLQPEGSKPPLFLVHGAADHLVKTAHSERIYRALTDNREIWIVEGACHARAARQAKLEYSERILSFFSEHLR